MHPLRRIEGNEAGALAREFDANVIAAIEMPGSRVAAVARRRWCPIPLFPESHSDYRPPDEYEDQ